MSYGDVTIQEDGETLTIVQRRRMASVVFAVLALFSTTLFVESTVAGIHRRYPNLPAGQYGHMFVVLVARGGHDSGLLLVLIVTMIVCLVAVAIRLSGTSQQTRFERGTRAYKTRRGISYELPATADIKAMPLPLKRYVVVIRRQRGMPGAKSFRHKRADVVSP